MSRTLRVGFIGGGINSAVGTTHFIAAQMDNRFRVEAGCFSRNKDINIQTGVKWGINPERIYNTAQELFLNERDRLDGIVILTPIPHHRDYVIQALKHGFPVICEKPLTVSSKDARVIYQTQVEEKGFLAVTYNYTGYPMVRELRHIIKKGRLGRIHQIHVEMPQEGFIRLSQEGKPIIPQSWRLQDNETTTTLSLDLGAHLHQLIDFLTGEKPVAVVSLQSSHGHFRQIVDNTMCIIQYTNSLECSMWFSKSALGYRNGLRVRVFGEYASAEWVQMNPEILILHDNRGHTTIIDRGTADVEIANLPRYNRFKAGHPQGFIEAFANVYWDIADSLEKYLETGEQEENEYVSTAQQSIEGLLLLEAINESARDRCWKTIGI